MSKPCTRLDGPWGLQEFEVPSFHDNRHMKVEGCQAYAPSAFTPRRYLWYSYLLAAESTPGPQYSWKDHVNGKSGIETRDLPVLARCLNQLLQLVPHIYIYIYSI